jgi:protein-tyrosine phosphatase
MSLPPAAGSPYRVSMVCLGNICRSPMAEAVLRHRVDEAGLGDLVDVDSGGTGSWHLGAAADPRARDALARRGYDGAAHRARQVGAAWFDERDLLLVMDEDNLRTMRRLAPDPTAAQRVVLLRSFDPLADGVGQQNVPDPYYGDEAEFDAGLDIIERSVAGLLPLLAAHVDGAGSAG